MGKMSIKIISRYFTHLKIEMVELSWVGLARVNKTNKIMIWRIVKLIFDNIHWILFFTVLVIIVSGSVFGFLWIWDINEWQKKENWICTQESQRLERDYLVLKREHQDLEQELQSLQDEHSRALSRSQSLERNYQVLNRQYQGSQERVQKYQNLEKELKEYAGRLDKLTTLVGK